MKTSKSSRLIPFMHNQLMQNINKKHIVSAFSESILMDAASVPSIENDLNPHTREAMEVESDEIDQADDAVSQNADEPLDESSEDEIPEEMQVCGDLVRHTMWRMTVVWHKSTNLVSTEHKTTLFTPFPTCLFASQKPNLT